ncbi:hypothetical protein GCM10009550_33870 [Actinocorallia libanotica]|uniref:Uncharacterized protein n=1 Tax=Actinocorallia libanotica TaxID=46162 RepID=A0ABP4BQ70_9ACTN
MLRRAARQAPARTEPTVSLLERDVAEAVEWAWELMDDGRLTRPSAPERGPGPKVGIALRGGVSLSWVSGWTHSTRARAWDGRPRAGHRRLIADSCT